MQKAFRHQKAWAEEYNLTVFVINEHCVTVEILGECMALWGEPNELSIQHHVYIFMQYVDSYVAS